MVIREATEADVPGILEIENHAIRTSEAHFGLDDVLLDQGVNAFRARGLHPWLVAENLGLVIGFARSSPWKEREAYRQTCEIGVYVRSGFHRKGVGTRLYEELFQALERAGFRTILAGIALPNDASIRLHENFGMVKVAHLPGVGFKHDRWIDVAYWAFRFDESVPGTDGRCES